MKFFIFLCLISTSVFANKPELLTFLNEIKQSKLSPYSTSLKQLDFYFSKTSKKQFDEFIEIELSKIIIPHPLIKLSKKYIIDHRQFKIEKEEVEKKMKSIGSFSKYFFKKITRDIELVIYSRNYRLIKSGKLTAMQMTPSLRSLKKKIGYLEKWWPWLKSTPAIEVDHFLKTQLIHAISKLARNSRIIHPVDEKHEFQLLDPQIIGQKESEGKAGLTKILEEKESTLPTKVPNKKKQWKPKEEKKSSPKKSNY